MASFQRFYSVTDDNLNIFDWIDDESAKYYQVACNGKKFENEKIFEIGCLLANALLS